MNNNVKRYKSRYIVNVDIFDDGFIYLYDSTNMFYVIEASNKSTVEQFKIWFKEIFSKGISHSLTVFSYVEKTINEVKCEVIQNFLNIPDNKV